jgi:hypothetical protein
MIMLLLIYEIVTLDILTWLILFFFSGYFTDQGSADIATMREGLKLSRKLANSESFSKYKGEEVFPGKHVQSDAELDAYIRDVRTCFELQYSRVFHFHYNYHDTRY